MGRVVLLAFVFAGAYFRRDIAWGGLAMVDGKSIEQYREKGYVLVRGVFTERQLGRLEGEFDGIVARRLAGKANLEATWAGEWKKGLRGDMALIHTHDLQAYSAEWTKALFHARLTGAMAKLLGTPNVQLHHTKLFQKPPERGAGFPMHQDYPYFPHERHSPMAAIIHLTPASDKMGCVRVYPGSHKLGPLRCGEHNHLDPKEWPLEGAKAVPARRGDVLFFNYLLVHGSGVNSSRRIRKTVLIQVRDPLDRPLDAQHRSHAQGLVLRGVHPLEGMAVAPGTLEAG